MNEHPIEGLMITAMNSIQDMIDVNTIIGEPIHADNNIVIIPVSKVTFGFAAGGSEFNGETIDEYSKKDKEEQIQYRLPFGGGSGAGVTINPVAFIVINNENVKLIPINHSSAIDKLLDYVPDLINKTSEVMNKCLNNKKEKTKEILKNMKIEEQKNNDKVNKIFIEKEIKKPIKDNNQNDFEMEFNEGGDKKKESKPEEIDFSEFEDE